MILIMKLNFLDRLFRRKKTLGNIAFDTCKQCEHQRQYHTTELTKGTECLVRHCICKKFK